jgi:hypothetical protein
LKLGAKEGLNIKNNWMKTISGERLLFGYFILSCRLNLRINLERTKCGPKGE